MQGSWTRVVFSVAAAACLWPGAAAVAGSVQLLSSTASTSGSMSLFGPAVTFTVPSGGSDAYGTQVVGAPIFRGAGGGAQLNTWAAVTQSLGSSRQVTMAWRTRTLEESFSEEPNANPSQPPLDLANGWFGLAGDVLDLSGFAPGEKYVLQMSYITNPAWYDEDGEIAAGCVQIHWLNPGTGIWEDATLGNSSNDPTRVVNYQGSWEQAGSPLTLGSWGVDKSNNVVWSVLDHNSEFAAVPEPASLLLVGSGATGFGIFWRRRQAGRPGAITRS